MKNTNWDTIITKYINKIIVKCLKDELYDKQKLLICLNLIQQFIYDANKTTLLLAYDKFDEKQYPRCYKDPMVVNGANCYFCSQWYEHSNSKQKLAEFISKYKGERQ